MPFTPSHAVVALPFVRTPLVPAAIAIGAMTPDLPLFVRIGPATYTGTHSLGGVPATMMLALGLLLVWRCILRPAARELVPQPIARRLPQSWSALGAAAGAGETFGLAQDSAGRPSRRWQPLALLAGSLAIGVVSHIVWDLFTHEGRWGTEVIPALAQPWGALPGYRWLQHASGILAGIVLVVWAARWLRRRNPAPRVDRVLPDGARWAVWLSLPAVLAVAAGWGLHSHGSLDDTFTLAHLAYLTLPPASAVWGAGLLSVSAFVAVRRGRTATSPGR